MIASIYCRVTLTHTVAIIVLAFFDKIKFRLKSNLTKSIATFILKPFGLPTKLAALLYRTEVQSSNITGLKSNYRTEVKNSIFSASF